MKKTVIIGGISLFISFIFLMVSFTLFQSDEKEEKQTNIKTENLSFLPDKKTELTYQYHIIDFESDNMERKTFELTKVMTPTKKGSFQTLPKNQEWVEKIKGKWAIETVKGKSIKDYQTFYFEGTYGDKLTGKVLLAGIGSDFVDTLLTFPAKIGKKWTVDYVEFNRDETIHEVIKNNETITTPAGTFEQVVVVKKTTPNNHSTYYVNYYAPHIGLIKKESKQTNGSTQVEMELIKIN